MIPQDQEAPWGTPYNEAPPPPQRRGLMVVLALLVAAAVVAGAVAVPALTRGSDEQPVAAAGQPQPVDLDAVAVFADEPTRHVVGEVDYDQSPPAGGDHDGAWLACGIYDEPVREENMVHSLEHGTVWVTYQPGLDDAAIKTLAAALPDERVVSPYDDQDAPVVITVWGRQLELTGADDPRLELFVAEFGDGGTAPEPLASCAGGVRTTDDGSTGVEV